MSALGTHEFTAGASLGFEPPLSPPVAGGPVASALPADGGLSELPSPPPAIRPPESAAAAPQNEVPKQPAPAPAPAAAPAPEPTLPVAPEQPEAPVIDYFAAEQQAAPAPPSAPAVEPEPQPEPEIPLMAPPAPTPVVAEEPVVEVPAMAPLEPVAPVEPLPAVQPAPAPEPAPAPAVEPEPIVEPVAPAAFVAPEPAEVVQEIAEVAPEIAEVAPEAHAVETLHVVEPFVAPEPQPEALSEPAHELEELFAASPAPIAQTDFRVVVRLKEGEGVVEVGSFRDFGTAMAGAQEVIEQFSNATGGQWPFYAGRFIRPDLIVSVDVVEGDEL